MKRPSDTDRDLFEQSMQDVAPLAERSRASQPHHASNPSLSNRASLPSAVPPMPMPHYHPLQGSEILDWRRPGLLNRDYQKLRTGRLSPKPVEFDLHGLKDQQAVEYICQTIAETQLQQRQSLCLIHGKGHRSGPEGSRIKGLTDALLRQHSEVLGFHSLPGNTGAVNVLLRKARP